MKKIRITLISLLLFSMIFSPAAVFAVEGSMGYEGGISVENTIEKGTYSYSEMVFITGEPVLLTGEMTIKKTDKNDTITSTYTYSLENTEKGILLNRSVIYTTTKETKANGQIIETTKLSREPTEVIRVGNSTYRLDSASFSQSMITDPKAAINYHTGEFTEKKVYVSGTGANQDTVTVTISGRIYAYDQYWSSTETQKLNIMIEADRKSGNAPSKWGGSAEITVSSATRSRIDYVENEPYQISFSGGYVRKVWRESVLNYSAKLPEFDKNRMPTDYLKTYTGSHSMYTPIELSRLMVPDIKHLNGYWAEEPISILFGLEVLPGTGEDFRPTKYITRREFVAMLMNAIKEVPQDPDLKKAAIGNKKTTSKKEPEISPFNDISPGDLFYEQVKAAYQKGVTSGNGNGSFGPNLYITKAEAVKMIVSALGLENLAPWPAATTPFTDNDSIPVYARNAAAVANILGIIEPDQKGAFNAGKRLTNEETALLLYDLINYMGDELVKDYRDRIIDY